MPAAVSALQALRNFFLAQRAACRADEVTL